RVGARVCLRSLRATPAASPLAFRLCPLEGSPIGSPSHRPWHILNFLPLPQGHGAFRGVLSHSLLTTGVLTTSSSGCGGAGEPPASTAACCAAAAAIVEPPLD